MKRFYFFAAALTLGSSCSSFHQNTAYNIWEDTSSQKRSPASVVSMGTPTFQNYDVSFTTSTQSICGLAFDRINLTSSHPEYLITPRWVETDILPFRYPVPDTIVSIGAEDKSILLRAGKSRSVTFKNPLLPDVPILPKERQDEICPKLKIYHRNFFSAYNSTRPQSTEAVKTLTNGFELNSAISYLSRKTAQPNEFRDSVVFPYDSLIIYDDLYQSEVESIARVHSRSGYAPKLLKLSRLPGLDARGEIPEECHGDYLKECYHFWNDRIEGVSPYAVGTLEGFFNQYATGEKYERISYIPGLIKAYIRSEKKKAILKGVFLIGNPDLIGPFYSIDKNSNNSTDNPLIPQSRLNTDLFYMLPDLKINPNGKLHFAKRSPTTWSCINSSGKVTLRYWCEADEERQWPEPPLSAYRWEPYVPVGRMMEVTGNTNTYFSAIADSEQIKNYQLSDVIPVGRLLTRNDLKGTKDPIVADYAEKIHRWHSNLPAIENNSLFSVGGSVTDTWTFLDKDLRQFANSFGERSKIYSSEFFVPLTHCLGKCEYRSGREIFSDMQEQKNRVMFLITGHGSYTGVQAPYANGNIPSNYYGENIWNSNMGVYIHTFPFKDPDYITVKSMEDGTLFGVTLANSCDLANYGMYNNEIHELLRIKKDREANQRSFGEQLLQVPNGGSVNTYLNSDVGYGGSDNYYNIKFMSKMRIAHDTCGAIGEALRQTVYDMIKKKTDGAGNWQLVNRQFQGSPLNLIAKQPRSCNIGTFTMKDREDFRGQR